MFRLLTFFHSYGIRIFINNAWLFTVQQLSKNLELWKSNYLDFYTSNKFRQTTSSWTRVFIWKIKFKGIIPSDSGVKRLGGVTNILNHMVTTRMLFLTLTRSRTFHKLLWVAGIPFFHKPCSLHLKRKHTFFRFFFFFFSVITRVTWIKIMIRKKMLFWRGNA